MSEARLPDQGATPPAHLKIAGPIATLTLDRPASFNAIDLGMARELRRLGAAVEADDSVRVLVLRGAGPSFCAGGDLKTFAGSLDEIAPTLRALLADYHEFVLGLRRMPKIVLTSVHGAAAGAGLSLAFMGDLSIAAEDARFVPAYAKLGGAPDGGGTVGIVDAVGARRALQIFLAEDGFSAAQALDWGLVAKIVPADALDAATEALAERLARNAPAAIAATKALLYQSRSNPVDRQLHAEMESLVGCTATEAFRAAVRRFAEGAKGG